ncbi:MAG: hypothetical protein JHC93_00160 [Parachlamydiales bacterium]|nr:hypothetical protein [Parachlamydiales bacterium]
MNFTREPIIETIITPKEGCKLAVRNSKGVGQEEYFVDALEVVSFGTAFFYRSLERPKCFLVPVADYEILEVRETRMVLKTPSVERVKIGGGRESSKPPKEVLVEKEQEVAEVASADDESANQEAGKTDGRNDKKRDRRRNRRRRGRDDPKDPAAHEEETPSMPSAEGHIEELPPALIPEVEAHEEALEPVAMAAPVIPPVFTALLPPPTTLISETISRYRGNPQYKKAFFTQNEEEGEESSASAEISTQVEEMEPLELPTEAASFQDEAFTPLEDEKEITEDFPTPLPSTFFTEEEDEYHPPI